MAFTHTIIDKDGKLVTKEGLTALKVVRLHCLSCSGYNRAEVRRCPIETCELWPLRMGSYPKSGTLSGRESLVKRSDLLTQEAPTKGDT